MAAKTFYFVILAILLISFMPVGSSAQGIQIAEGISLDGQIRARGELDNKDFNSDNSLRESSGLRTRLGLSINKIENTKIYIQLQDSRGFGDNSGALDNDINLGVHQAYVRFKDPWDKGISAQVGRFEMKYGRERIIGVVGWSDVGRTFDGILFNYDHRYVDADFFIVELSRHEYFAYLGDRRNTLFGFYTQWLNKHFHVFALYNWDRFSDPGSDYLKRWTLGSHYNRTTSGGLDINLDFAYQLGDVVSRYRFGEVQDISAYMFATEFGYTFKSDIKPHIAAGLDMASGNEIGETDKEKKYSDLYYTGHAFRGYMDLFVSTPEQGLMDIFLRTSIQPHAKIGLALDFHHFKTMEDYTFLYYVNGATYTDESTALGQEFDFTAKAKVYDGLMLQAGASLFFPSDDWKGDDADMGAWFYTMLTADLK
jgi:hypothetical protein